MELWATGFNAWGQLQHDRRTSLNLKDLDTFTCILKDDNLEVYRTSVSGNLVRTRSGLKLAGYASDDIVSLCLEKQDRLPCVAVAGNNKVAAFSDGYIRQYISFQNYFRGESEFSEATDDIVQIEANQTSFTALSSTGQVYTWGDERYEACLGRDITKECPASRPAIVEELSDLPDKITKISSCGYVTAALTSANDAYFWGRGGHPAGLISGSPMPLDLDGQDILDMSVGFNHVIILTTEHKMYMVGNGENGQLGESVEVLEGWKEIKLPLKDEQRIRSVQAGYKNTLLVIENTPLR